MMLSLLLSMAPAQSMVAITHEAPNLFVEGESYVVTVRVEAPDEVPTPLATWVLSPAAFTVNGRPLGKRDSDATIELEPGSRLSLSLDLGPRIQEFEGFDRKNFRLGFGIDRELEPIEVTFFEAAEKGIDFIELPVEQLSDYQVLMRTSRGVIWLELWADVASNHVRNFLDLAYTGFYDGTLFHRVIPSFMIQGGQAKPGSKAPRTLQAEFSTKRHVPGVLSAARLGHDINSASSEFFIVHGVSPHLDGQYSAFGRTVEGLDVVDRIAASYDQRFPPGDPRGEKPVVDQVIEKVIVVRAPRKWRPAEDSR